MTNFEGYGSEDRLVPNKKCRHCKRTGGVHYMGSSVEHGNPFTPAADTEVDHHYHCNKCKKSWRE